METAESIKKAFALIRREDFVPKEMRPLASLDEALPIGWEQTISQPAVVRFMLELLNPKQGDHILDIGAGSGWTTTLLAHIIGNGGKVVGLEIIPELAKFGKENIAKYGFIENGIAKYFCQDAQKGYPPEAPYDAILVSASLPKKELPRAWREQLRIGGRIVVPIKESIWVFTKRGETGFQEKEYPGFVFVPFVS